MDNAVCSKHGLLFVKWSWVSRVFKKGVGAHTGESAWLGVAHKHNVVYTHSDISNQTHYKTSHSQQLPYNKKLFANLNEVMCSNLNFHMAELHISLQFLLIPRVYISVWNSTRLHLFRLVCVHLSSWIHFQNRSVIHEYSSESEHVWQRGGRRLSLPLHFLGLK